MNPTDPRTWHAPDWHPDWRGDVEIVLLREFAQRLLAEAPDSLGVCLVILEPGYMHVAVTVDGVHRLDVLIPNGDSPRFAVWPGDSACDRDLDLETYFDDAASAVQFVRDRCDAN